MPTLPKLAPASPCGRGRGRRWAGAEPPPGRAWTRPRFRSLAEQAPGGRLRGSGQARRAGEREDPREGERRRAEEGGGGAGESECARARVRAPWPSPRPSPPPSLLAPLVSPPRAAAQPPESVQLLPCRLRIPPVPPSAATPLGASAQPHRSRPVSPGPSRGQPQPRQPRGVASRPTRPAAEEREEDGTPAPPPPHPWEVGRGSEAERCQLTGAASWRAPGRRAAGRRAAGPGREGAAAPPLPCSRGAAWGRGGCRAGAGAARAAWVSNA